MTVGRVHLDALSKTLDLLDSFPSQVRKWVLVQITSNGSSPPSSKPVQTPVQTGVQTALQTRVQTDVQNAFEQDLEVAFSRFWTAFPRRQGKQGAYRSYQKLKPDQELQERILKALHEQKAWDQWQDSKFIPLPSTWLNNRRWEDEQPSSKAMFGKTSSNVFEGFMERHP
mgnify:CR=1 FL=1